MEKQTKRISNSPRKKKKIIVISLLTGLISLLVGFISFSADTFQILQILGLELPKVSVPTKTPLNISEESVKPIYPSVPDSDYGCPIYIPDNPDLPSVNVMVRYWCAQNLYDPKGRIVAWQYTLRPRFVNNSSEAISVSIKGTSAIRLLVDLWYVDNDGKRTDKLTKISENWKPVPTKSNSTAKNSDKPFLIVCDNHQFWAIPPDQVENYYDIGNEYQGFSTKWYIDKLESNETLFYDAGTDNGVLSFHVPDKKIPVYGLAVIDPDTHKILGIAHRASAKEWGESSRFSAMVFW